MPRDFGLRQPSAAFRPPREKCQGAGAVQDASAPADTPETAEYLLLPGGRLHSELAGFEQFEILYVKVVQPCALGGKDDEAEVDTAMIPGNDGGNQKVDRRKGREKTDKGSPQLWRSGWVHNQARPQQHGPPEREHSGLGDDLEWICAWGIPQ